MKKFITGTLAGILALSLVSCSSSEPEQTPVEEGTEVEAEAPEETVTLTVGATAVPHAELLNLVKDDLLEQGINLEVQEFSDYALLNPALSSGEIDANFFQHQPYLDSYLADSGDSLVSVASVHVEPMRVYSKTITDISELQDGDKVALPNDATNEGRALLLLDTLGIIALDDNTNILCTPSNIVENPLNLEFIELDGYLVPRSLDDAAIAIINTNVALESGIDAEATIIGVENEESPYANIIVARPDDAESDAIAALCSAITSQEIYDYINDTYEGAVVPAFTPSN